MSEALKNPFRLGFGLMRLPKLADGSIDVPQVCEMADRFLAAGGTYFDTAFVYDGGASEAAFRKAVVERYPRDAYTIATKLHATAAGIRNAEEARQELFTSLERMGTEYVDYYLLHAIQTNNIGAYDEYGLWDFVREQKAAGRIRHWGFSFHATPELLEELLTRHPDAEFVQLQINYADWEYPGVDSRKCYEICRAHGKPVVIMEPVKGGMLADPVPEVKAVFDQAEPGKSYASWALRYAAGLEGILAVLSGMSNEGQMADNLATFADFRPLDEAEQAVIARVQAILNEDKSIACTACHYCTKGCPMGIPIPEIFGVMNRRQRESEFHTHREYGIVTQNKGKASDCIGCGQCEGACPQHLPIVELLQQCRAMEG